MQSASAAGTIARTSARAPSTLACVPAASRTSPARVKYAYTPDEMADESPAGLMEQVTHRPVWMRAAPWFAAAAALVVLDQWTKHLVLQSLLPGERIVVTGFFNFVLVFNTGAAFSFLADAGGWQKALFALIAVVASLIVSFLLVRHAGQARFCAGLALVLSGAIGNLIDRIRFGHVVDFLDFHALGWHWPAFNVADSAITLGVAILILDSLLTPRAKDANA